MEFKELAAAQQAAKQGNAEAQCCLGDFYSSGLGVLTKRPDGRPLVSVGCAAREPDCAV